MPPDFSFEERLPGIVCGIDEVGRGPLAGPVVAAAVVLPRLLPATLCDHLDDSKKLSAKARERLFAIIMDCAQVGIGEASVAEIDRINILKATFLAMGRAFAALSRRTTVDHALVDGNQTPPLPVPVRCLVKGDSRSFSIAAASVVAKVTRDRQMTALADAFPGYGWDRNAGYGTAAHRQAMARLGLTPHHRRSFGRIGDLFESL
jgi:ribonuclease HII